MVKQSILVHQFKLKKDDFLFNVLVIIFKADFWIYWNEISWRRFARFIYLLGSRDQVLFQIDFRQSSVNFSDISDPDVFWYCPNLKQLSLTVALELFLDLLGTFFFFTQCCSGYWLVRIFGKRFVQIHLLVCVLSKTISNIFRKLSDGEIKF